MSRKTKKEKIAAEARRKLRPDSYQVSTTFSSKETTDVFQSGVKQYSVPVVNSANVVGATQNSYAYVTSDLKRILLFTALAFCAQLVLWYFLR